MNQRVEKLNGLEIFYESFWNLESPRIFFPYAQRLVLVYARRSMKSANYHIELQCHVVRYGRPNVAMFNSLFSSVSRILECLHAICHHPPSRAAVRTDEIIFTKNGKLIPTAKRGKEIKQP